MKIGLITPLPLDTHGVANYGHFLLKAFLREAKKDEFIVFSTSRTRPRHESNLRIVPILETEGDYSSRLADEVIKLRPDVLHIQHDYEIFGLDARFLDFLEILRTEGVKTVVTLHSVYDKDFCPLCTGDIDIESYQREMAFLSYRIVVHHGIPSRRILLKSGVPTRKVKVLRHGTWNYEKEESIEARRFLGLPEEDVIIGVISSYGPLTDLSFLDPIPDLRGREKRVLFWIVGNSEKYGFDPDSLEKDAIAKGYGNNVIVSDIMIPIHWIKEVFSAPDMILVPSVGERESTDVLHYALPAGKPVLMTEESRAFEEVAFFISRELLYPKGDTSALTQSILRILEDENFKERIRCRTERYALKTDWNNIARLHLNLYRSIARESMYPSLTGALGLS